ncbi:Glycosyl phosphatidyl inositol anchor synthesis [Sorochytrium milnesiophthora]
MAVPTAAESAKRRRKQQLYLLVLGIVFHAAYVLSVFDIYFRTPLVHGMTPHSPSTVAAATMGRDQSQTRAPAKRLVLFVADGLRADKLFERPDAAEAQRDVTHKQHTYHDLHSNAYDDLGELNAPKYSFAFDDTTRAPYLRSIVRSTGAWGVSHTRVPTESRPGHVAIIAGFYEDVSAVTKGWKLNPVEFDSLFNESRHTWSFGSPDILPMFQHGASNAAKIETFMYSPDYEDFSTDAAHLDTWVFDNVEALFTNSSAETQQLLRQDKIVFFLHLLGLDTNGHAFRPYSAEYLDNIRLVDVGIQRTVALMDRFYGDDGQTAYVFTADHGMHNRGNHGDGDPDNTRTPMIAWGAGVRGPVKEAGTAAHDAYSADWDNADRRRADVRQADIAPLMASLIDVPFPLNNVGKLPLSYLNASQEYQAYAFYSNARQILEQFVVKEEQKRRTEQFFTPYTPLFNRTQTVASIERMLKSLQYAEAIAACDKLIDAAIDGLRYYQTYDWLFLRSVVSSGYVGWMLYSLLHVVSTYAVSAAPPLNKASPAVDSEASRTKGNKTNAVALAVWLALTALLLVKRAPLLYHVYVAFPVYFWRGVCRHDLTRSLLWGGKSRHLAPTSYLYVLGVCAIYLLGLQVLVYSYFERSVLSACLALLAAWPAVMPAPFRRRNMTLLVVWTLSCLACAVFPLLSVERDDYPGLVYTGAALLMAANMFVYQRLHQLQCDNSPQGHGYRMIAIEGALIMVSAALVLNTNQSLSARTGLPLFNQIASWVVLGWSFSIPFIYGRDRRQHYLLRLAIICFAFVPSFVFLSTSYEVLFYAVLCLAATAWMLIEQQLYAHQEFGLLHSGIFDVGVEQQPPVDQLVGRPLAVKDARLALIFLLFINLAFFGTGNVASLSSFTLSSVYRLITVFSPFVMGALLIAKILVPFFYISAVFTVLCRSIDLPPFSLFLFVISTVDVMTLNFFWLVRDDGSWLEIGMSISHFAIASGFIVFLCLLFGICALLVGNIIVPVGGRKKNE